MAAEAVPLAIAGSASVAVGFGFARYGFGSFVSTFRSEFGLSTAMVGAVGSAASAAYLVALLACGVLTARFGPRLPVFLANLSALVGLGMVACAASAPVLIAGLVVAAASSGLVWGPFADAIGGHVEPRWQDSALSVVGTGTTFGLIVVGALALWVSDHAEQSWRVAWLAFTAMAAAVTIVAFIAVPRGAAAQKAGPTRFRPTWAIAPLSGLSALYGLAGATFFTFAVDLVRGEGFDPRWSSLLWLLVGVGGISGVATAKFVKIAGLEGALLAGVALLAATIAAMAVNPTSVTIIAIAALGFGFAYMPFASLLWMWNQRLHPSHPTSGLVVTLCSLGVGSIIGPVAFGAVADAHGLRLAFVATAALFAICALPLCRRVRRSMTSSSQRI
jgi:predicted MFS family arabinose efflux permease